MICQPDVHPPDEPKAKGGKMKFPQVRQCMKCGIPIPHLGESSYCASCSPSDDKRLEIFAEETAANIFLESNCESGKDWLQRSIQTILSALREAVKEKDEEIERLREDCKHYCNVVNSISEEANKEIQRLKHEQSEIEQRCTACREEYRVQIEGMKEQLKLYELPPVVQANNEKGADA